MAPNITTPPKSQVIITLSNVTFTCAAVANPQAVIQWELHGNVLSNHSDSHGIKILIVQQKMGDCRIIDPPSDCEVSSTLEIFNIQPADSGEYTCNASNVAGISTKSAVLTVTGTIVASTLQ